MDLILELAFILIKVAVAGIVFLGGLHMMKTQKSNSMKAKVLQLQARLSRARMALRAKVKKKANIFRSTIKAGILEGDVIDRSLKTLNDLNFETSQDFQNYFDVSRHIVSLIHADPKNKMEVPPQVENNFMCLDFKTELDIIRIIREMASITVKINEAIEENNTKHPNQSMEKADPLLFPAMADVNRVFKSDANNTAAANAAAPQNSQKKVS